MIKVNIKGDFKKLDEYFNNAMKESKTKYSTAEIIANSCAERLREATPKDSGLTADSWEYEIVKTKYNTKIIFSNTNIQNGINIALLLEYGHGTSSGSWIEGRNYIEPTIQKAFLDAVDKKWEDIKDL